MDWLPFGFTEWKKLLDGALKVSHLKKFRSNHIFIHCQVSIVVWRFKKSLLHLVDSALHHPYLYLSRLYAVDVLLVHGHDGRGALERSERADHARRVTAQLIHDDAPTVQNRDVRLLYKISFSYLNILD